MYGIRLRKTMKYDRENMTAEEVIKQTEGCFWMQTKALSKSNLDYIINSDWVDSTRQTTDYHSRKKLKCTWRRSEKARVCWHISCMVQ